jgi:hypothetical protein
MNPELWAPLFPNDPVASRRLMTDMHNGTKRDRPDRRKRPTSPACALWHGGRRKAPRRREERSGSYFVDRFDALTLAMIVALLGLTITDGLLTIELLDQSSSELNPLLAHLLGRGHHAFLAAKYILTASGLPFLVVFKNYRLFGTRFRAGYLFPAFLTLYLMLLFYQWNMLR